VKKTVKMLTLSRETLRHLAYEQAREVRGGYQWTAARKDPDPPPTSDSVVICCA
jgi:hypothetical protein